MLVAWTKACLTFTRSLNHKKEEREEKNGLKLNFLSFPSLFFLFLSSLSFMSIFFFTYTREAAAIVFLCMFAFRKQETFLLYLRLYKKLYYSNFRISVCQRQIACNGQLYFQLLWDAYSGTCDALSRIVIVINFSQGVPFSSVPTSKLYMST